LACIPRRGRPDSPYPGRCGHFAGRTLPPGTALDDSRDGVKPSELALGCQSTGKLEADVLDLVKRRPESLPSCRCWGRRASGVDDLRATRARQPDVSIVYAAVQIATALVLVYESHKGTQEAEEQGCFFHGTPPGHGIIVSLLKPALHAWRLPTCEGLVGWLGRRLNE